MKRIPFFATLSAACFVSSVTSSQAQEICPDGADGDGCVGISICVTRGGTWINGVIETVEDGRFEGTTIEGVSCEGVRDPDTSWRFGGLDITCEDGSEIEMLLYANSYQDDLIIGVGEYQNGGGDELRSWMGSELHTHFSDTLVVGNIEGMCGSRPPGY